MATLLGYNKTNSEMNDVDDAHWTTLNDGQCACAKWTQRSSKEAVMALQPT